MMNTTPATTPSHHGNATCCLMTSDADDNGSVLPEHVWIISRVVLPAICVLGVLGLIQTIVVLSHRLMNTSTNVYLRWLAVSDLLFLLLLPTTLLDAALPRHSPQYYAYAIYVTHAAVLMHVLILASVWLTVMLAVERYVAICRPFSAGRLCTVGKARAVTAVIYVLALACRLPNFWENRVVTIYDTTTNSTFAYMEITELSLDEHYMLVYPWLVDGLITSVLPFLLLLVLNARLIWAVRASTRYLQRTAGGTGGGAKGAAEHAQREELQVTVMLISVIIVFFLCQAPYVIYTAIVSIRRFAAPSNALMIFRYITMMLLTLKSAINFILYCWFSEKFRTTLRKLCYRWRPSSCCHGDLMKGERNGCSGGYHNLHRSSMASNSQTRDTVV